MAVSTPEFLRFVKAVHRRYVVCRSLERTGVGLLAGSVAALVLLPFVLWADRPPLPLVSAALALGPGIGLLWGIFRQPSRLESAMRADRQLDLEDLLGTALTLDSPNPGPWGAAVLSLANARCERLKPRDVLLRRISARAWSGIGLSATAALALGLFFGSPADSDASAPHSKASVPATNLSTLPNDESDRPLIAMAPGAPGAAAEHEDPEDRSLGRSTPPQTGDLNPPLPAQSDPSLHKNSGTSPGSGGGSSQTKKDKDPAASQIPHPEDAAGEPRAEPAAASAPTNASGTSGGSALPDGSKTSREANPAGTVTNAARGPNPRPTPPWKADAWAADVQRAHAALDAGQVPAAYQEMVRRYFDR
jgi:hypothetical protein